MRFQAKLRYLLPLVQMTIASALLWWSYAWTKAIMLRLHSGTTGAPIFTLLLAINAPVMLPRILWFELIGKPWSEIALVPLVGLLWYCVALSIERRSVVMFKLAPLRIAADLVLSIFGAVLGLYGIAEIRTFI